MAAERWSVPRLQDEIAVLAARGLARDEFFAELAPRLRRVIDNDATCWHTLDPQTRLLTSDAPAELIERGVYTPETASAAGELLVRSEYLIPDVNTFAGLASQARAGGDPRAARRAAGRSGARATATSWSRREYRTSCGLRS